MALDATDRSRQLWDRIAPRYNRDVGRLEPLLFGRDARGWVCAQASGDAGTPTIAPMWRMDAGLGRGWSGGDG